MAKLTFFIPLLLAAVFIPHISAFAFGDSLVAPTPPEHYVRYVNFLANGTRTYICNSNNATAPYTLKASDYDMYNAETDPESNTILGKHVLLPQKDAQGGNSVFYTATSTFTYWLLQPRLMYTLRD